MPNLRSLFLRSLLPILVTIWLYQVNKTVPEPYLDEIFHIRQAQAYCHGEYKTWDPKITTPPGLYLVSLILLKVQNLVLYGDRCGVRNLRSLNALAAVLVLPLLIWSFYDYSRRGGNRRTKSDDGHDAHNILNICLFPLLLFLSGLYYTDLWSVAFVLAAYVFHLRCLGHDRPWRRVDAVAVFFLGLAALLMRQTNIFWVAVYLAGQSAVHDVKFTPRENSGLSKDSPDASGAIYDPPTSEAYFEGTNC
jgi:alpha-1,2-glucosyltransferase